MFKCCIFNFTDIVDSPHRICDALPLSTSREGKSLRVLGGLGE